MESIDVGLPTSELREKNDAIALHSISELLSSTHPGQASSLFATALHLKHRTVGTIERGD